MKVDTGRHALVIYNDSSLYTRVVTLAAGFAEEFLEILYTWLTRKGRLERALESNWRTRAAKMVNLERILRQRNGTGFTGGLRYRRVNTIDTIPEETEAESVLKDAQISADGSRREAMRATLHRALVRMDAHDALIDQVEALRTEAYDPSNGRHEQMLMRLWECLMPGEALRGMVSEQWKEIGFQGCDPSTDFRGMGILSLHQLIYFAEHEPSHVEAALSLSRHPRIGFPFAVAGITFTSLTRALLESGQLVHHFYNTLHDPPTIEDVHHAYVRIYSLFCQYFKRANPPNVMYFNEVRMSFERALSLRLLGDDANLDELTVDHL